MIFGNEPNGDKCYVRRYFTHRDDVIKKLLDNVCLSDLDQRQELQLREYSLKVLFYLHQIEAQKLGPMLQEPLYSQRQKLQSKIDTDKENELASSYQDEIQLVDDALCAPSRPFKTNYIPQEKPNYKNANEGGVLHLKD